MEMTEDEQPTGENQVKHRRDGTGKPARMAEHGESQYEPRNHRRKVNPAECQRSNANGAARLEAASAETMVRPADGQQNQYLRGKQRSVWKRGAVPRFERWQPDIDDERERLRNDAKCEEPEQQPSGDGVTPRGSHPHPQIDIGRPPLGIQSSPAPGLQRLEKRDEIRSLLRRE